jgi:RNA polymerase sigma-70 factor (ECF subfamily)
MNEHRAGSQRAPAERRERFEALYRECCGPVSGYVLRRTENPEDAADVIAETFLIAWRRLDDVPASEQRLWLYGVARRVSANHRRGRRVRTSLTERLTAELASAPRLSEPTDDLAALGTAFRRLSDADREVLALEGWEGLGYEQIATVLGCSRNAVRIRLHRARRRLARQLTDQQSGEHPPVVTLGHGETT